MHANENFVLVRWDRAMTVAAQNRGLVFKIDILSRDSNGAVPVAAPRLLMARQPDSTSNPGFTLRARIVPLCSSTARLAMASPRPTPPACDTCTRACISPATRPTAKIRRWSPKRRATLMAEPRGGNTWRSEIRLQGDRETVFFDV